MSHPTSTGTRRRSRLPLLISAALVWVLALTVPTVLGQGRLEHLLGGPRGSEDPVVGLAIVGDPTLQWTGIGRGIVEMNYELTLTGAASTTVTLTRGTANQKQPTISGPDTTVTLTEGTTHRGTLRQAVTCTNRVKVGVAASGPLVNQAEVFTWVQGIKDTKGNRACSLI